MECYRHHVISIGCNTYDDARIPNLRWAEADAFKLAEAWLRYENTVVLPKYILASGQFLRPTRSNILGSLDSLRNTLTEQDVLWFSFSGHGVVINDMHRLILADTKLSRQAGSFDIMEQTSLDIELIVRYLRHSKAGRIVIFLDCCNDILPNSDRNLKIYQPMSEKGQDIARIGVLWSQRAMEIQEWKNGALTKAWLDTLLAPERLAEPKDQSISVYFQSLNAKYQELCLARASLNLPPVDVICNLDRWHVPTLKAWSGNSTGQPSTDDRVFRIDFPVPGTDGRFVHYAYGTCSITPSEDEESVYYGVLQDRPSALYCQYPHLMISENGCWRAENIIVGHGITFLHIVIADLSLATELERLASQKYFGALPESIRDKVIQNIVASVELQPFVVCDHR